MGNIPESTYLTGEPFGSDVDEVDIKEFITRRILLLLRSHFPVFNPIELSMNPNHVWLPIARLFLLFGTECEVLLTPKSHMAVSNWDDLVQKLSTVLEQNGIPNEIIEGRRSGEYTKWSLTADASIRQNRQAEQWDLELISNVQAIFHENDDL